MWASGVKSAGGTPPVLTDRGEYNAWDYQIGDLTTDGTWNDLDLSAIVGAAVRLVCIRIQWASANSGDYMEMRTKYGATVKNQTSRRTQVAASTQESDVYVLTDSAGKIEVVFANAVFTTIRLCIRHWWSVP